MTPYIIDSLKERNKLAVTKLLFVNPYNKLAVSNIAKKCFNIKITESYIRAYLHEYYGTIFTGLSSGIEYFSYLCPTIPFHHLPLWKQVYLKLGCLSYIRNANQTEIVEIRESAEFHNFIFKVRNFIYEIVRLTFSHEVSEDSIFDYIKSLLRTNINSNKSSPKCIDDFLFIIDSAFLNDKTNDTKIHTRYAISKSNSIQDKDIIDVKNELDKLEKINILFLASNPTGTAKLNLDEEYRIINQNIRKSIDKDKFSLDIEWAITPDKLQESILRYEPNILHFTGHGEKSNQDLINLAKNIGHDIHDGAGIILHDKENNIQLVPTKALSNMFKILINKVNLKILILSACHSENQAVEIGKYIPYVIGMNNEIGINAATEFSNGFYLYLTNNKFDIPLSFQLAKNLIELWGYKDSCVPVLYRHGKKIA